MRECRKAFLPNSHVILEQNDFETSKDVPCTQINTNLFIRIPNFYYVIFLKFNLN